MTILEVKKMDVARKLTVAALIALLSLTTVACSAEGNIGEGGADAEIEGEGEGEGD